MMSDSSPLLREKKGSGDEAFIKKRYRPCFLTIILTLYSFILCAQQKAIITIDPSKLGNPVSPTLHGVFFEEISHSGEGGLYAELIQNRGFEETNLPPGTTLVDGFVTPPRTPHFSMPNNGVSDWKMEWTVKTQYPAWSSKANDDAALQLSLTTQQPLNSATPHSLHVAISRADEKNKANVLNEGFWGINVIKGEDYNLSFYLRSNDYKGSVMASLQDEVGNAIGSFVFTSVSINGQWRKYKAVLKAIDNSKAAKFVLSFNKPGNLWLDFVSLFPAKTFKNRPNGLRRDLAQYIADLKPAFIRWPGGCFVEGITIQSAPDWKRTIGTVEKRPGTYSPWGYWTSDGFGYHEYLQYCEDIGAAALYVFNAGVSCDFRSGTFVSDDSLQPYIQAALNAIEYAIGSPTSKWGRIRAAAGHSKPFPLKYVEVGNEQSGPRYAERYNRFYEAIKTKYPSLQVVASMGIGDVNEHTLKNMKHVDLADEHAYKAAGWAANHFDHFDKYKRGDWKMYVGEYATNAGVGNGNMEAALSDAIYIMGMEKNGDLVKMSSYAPLLVNTADVDWPVNLINFNAAESFARISYYTIKMLNEAKASVNVATNVTIVPPAVKAPAFAGSIGLATWDTQTEYAGIEVIQNGKTVYKSNFKNRLADWELSRGEWKSSDSSLRQTAEGAQLLAWLKGRSFDTYTLKLKARKLSGLNAFIIPFAVKDSNTQLRAHIGSWWNSRCVFESVSGGYDVASLTDQMPLGRPIDPARWYNIRLDVGLDSVACYLDDTLLMIYKDPPKFFSIAGKDSTTGDVIVKMVNTSSQVFETTLDLKGNEKISSEGEWVSLSAPSAKAENSFAQPKEFTPKTMMIADVRKTISIPAYSINVIRIKQK